MTGGPPPQTDVVVVGGGIAGCCAAYHLAARGVPVVLVESQSTPLPGAAKVGVANWDGGRLAAEHLLLLGHRRLGVIAGHARHIYSRARVDASWHETRAMLRVVDRLVGLDVGELAKIGPIGRERADLMLPGCAIFAAICSLWPAPMLRVADRGLREGMLRQLATTP